MNTRIPKHDSDDAPANAWLQRLLERSRPAAMPRRLFLKISGASGLTLGWGCTVGGDQVGVDGSDGGEAGGTGGSGADMGDADVSGDAPSTSGGTSMSGESDDPTSDGTTTNGTGDTTETTACEQDCECGPPTEEPKDPGSTVPQVDLNAYVRIGTDDTITLYSLKVEMGQGVLTALPMLLAEELEVDWTKVRSEHPIASPSLENQQLGIDQFTVSSASVSSTYLPMRQMGAAAREMLIAAAAQQWGVDASECRAELGEVIHDGSSRRARYGELAELAATMPAPQNPRLKDPSEFKIIGTPRTQLGAREKCNGTAQYSIDVKVPDMVVGLVAFPPSVGGSVASFDATAALAVPGVRDVVEISAGVAVLGDHFWAAYKGRQALEVQWNAGPNATLSSAQLRETIRASLDGGQDRLTPVPGDPEGAFDSAPEARRLDVEYELPYLAHAPLEPLNAVAHVRSGEVEVWAGTQVPNNAASEVARVAGVSRDAVIMHVPLLGGAFGRRATNDFVVAAVEASMASGLPVKILYTREDDMRSANYRPMNCNRLRGAIDDAGRVTSWIHNIGIQGIFGGAFATEGASTHFPYAIPNRRVTWSDPRQGMPVFTWRSVGSSHNAFVVECFLDELAALGGRDPLDLRLELLDASSDPNAPRVAAVLQDVAEISDWGATLPAGRGRGLAVHQTFGTIVAQVAEVSVEAGELRVHKVWASVDCGYAVNPRGIEAQVEGSIMFGLSAALYGEITVENGAAVQGNFDRYRLVRISEAPDVEVSIVNSGASITGMGEPAVPPVAPAVCNAIYAASGQRIRQLPIVLS